MKRKWLLGLILQLAFLPAAYGLYSGNPADPMLGNSSIFFCDNPWWSPKLGYQRDYITDRKLKSDDLPVNRLDQFEIVLDQGTVAWDFCGRFEIYGSVGAGRTHVFAHADRAAPACHKDFHAKDNTVWSVGGKIILFDWCNTIVGVDGKYFEHKSKFTSDDLHTGTSATNAKVRYKEWQASIGAAYNFCCAVPYINVNFAGLVDSSIHDINVVPVDTGVVPNDFKLKTDKHVGLSLGTSFVPSDSFYVTVECRFINERALTLQGQIKF